MELLIFQYMYAKLNIDEIARDGDSLDKLMGPSKKCIAIIAERKDRSLAS